MYRPQCLIDLYWSTVNNVQQFPPYSPPKGHYCLRHDSGIHVLSRAKHTLSYQSRIVVLGSRHITHGNNSHFGSGSYTPDVLVPLLLPPRRLIHSPGHPYVTMAGRKLLCEGGGVTQRPIFPTPPLLGRHDGRGGSGRGCPTCRAGGGGGFNPTSMAQNDTHVVLIILTTQMWRGGGLLVEKTFSGQNLCSRAFGANIHSHTKQRARHGTPFLQTPPVPSFGGRPCHPPPPRRAIFRSPTCSTCTSLLFISAAISTQCSTCFTCLLPALHPLKLPQRQQSGKSPDNNF